MLDALKADAGFVTKAVASDSVEAYNFTTSIRRFSSCRPETFFLLVAFFFARQTAFLAGLPHSPAVPRSS